MAVTAPAPLALAATLVAQGLSARVSPSGRHQAVREQVKDITHREEMIGFPRAVTIEIK